MSNDFKFPEMAPVPLMVKDLTMRDHFAGLAMQALIQAKATLPDDDEVAFSSASEAGFGAPLQMFNENDERFCWGSLLAVEAYEVADFMLKEREARGEK